jgi:hypothetical protein
VEFDYTEEVVEPLGSPLLAIPNLDAAGADDMRWDCSIGGLNFLFAMSNEFRFKRETAQFRRERIDNERDPGEQSLDSGLWIRSQASWHYGAGLRSAEPLEVNTEEARFRYFQSGGIDPWDPGFLRLLNSASSVFSASAVNTFLDGIDTGVLFGYNVGSNGFLTYITNANVSASVNWGGAGLLHSIADTGQYWLASNSEGIWRGDLPGAAGTKIYNNPGGTTRSLVRWVKSRVMYANMNTIREITNLTPTSATLPTALYSHPNGGWTWTDFAEGPNAIYASGYSNEVSQIYRISINTTATTVTLSQPTVVAEMPNGEEIYKLYSYLGSFLVVGTNKGIRVASIQPDGSLIMGPSIYEDSPVDDIEGFGNYLYFTARRKGTAGNRVDAPGLYRINLGQVVDGEPLRFAYASDIHAFGTPAGNATSVTVSGGRLWFGVTLAGGGVFKQSTEFVEEGWIETGRIRLGTLEKKAWRDLRLLAEPGIQGNITAYASFAGTGSPSTWREIITANLDRPDNVGSLTPVSPFAATDLFVAFRLRTNPTCQCSASMIGYQVRAVPSPRRNELIEVPVMLFDWEIDRTGARYGALGNAHARFRALKSLEQQGQTITWRDFTTGEAAEGYVEGVFLNRMTPPTSGFQGSGAGGVCRVLIRLV